MTHEISNFFEIERLLSFIKFFIDPVIVDN